MRDDPAGGQGRVAVPLILQVEAQHLLAGVPHGTYVECFADPERDPVWQTMWANRPAPKNGMIELSPGPGFGLQLDAAMVRRYRADPRA